MRTLAATILSLCLLTGHIFGQEGSAYRSDVGGIPTARQIFKTSEFFSFQAPQASLLQYENGNLVLDVKAWIEQNQSRTTLVMDSTATYFTISKTIFGIPTSRPIVMTIDDYVNLHSGEQTADHFRNVVAGKLQIEERSGDQSFELIGADIAGQRVSLRVRGNVNITGKLRNEDRTKTTNVNQQNQSNTFQIEQKQAFKIEGKIGDRISIQVDQDSERDFDFENNMEIYYNGNEDEIIQRVEAGNISLSLPGTKLAMFSGQNNGLFGLKALAKIGPVDITTIASLERGRKEKLSLSGSSKASEISIEDYNRQRNTYFYINKFYRRKSYPLTDKRLYARTGRSIQQIKVYKYTSYTQGDEITNYARIYNYPNTDSAVVTSRRVIQLEQGIDKDFVVYEELGVIRMNRPVPENEILAIAYKDTFIAEDVNGNTTNLFVNEYDPDRLGVTPYPNYQEGSDVALGTPGLADTLDLKMIKTDNALPSDETWDLEWKNVFSLKSTSINKEGFDLKLVRSLGGENEELAADGKPFLQLFGLDKRGIGDDPTPDGIIDLDYQAILNLRSGELILPYLKPFMADSAVAGTPDWKTDASGNVIGNGGNPNLVNYPEYQSSSFYTNTINSPDYRKDSKFRIDVTYSNPSSNFSLGFNVIEGSEEVTLNGVPLVRGASNDYTIDYFTGQLTILNEAALAPGANLDIKYELNEFFQLDKKVIMGSRAEIKFGEDKNSFVGLSAIYFSKSSIDEKVRVGKEPMENFIWDLNTRISKELPWLTRGLDWLPLITTDANSNVTLSGEIAQVIPNPNTAENKELNDFGVAYLDDFEGSRRVSQLSILRGSWGQASIPMDNSGRDNYDRAYTYWYNPYNRVFTKSIWPNKETSAQAQNDVTDILSLRVIPDSSFSVQAGDAPGNAWGGIMRALSSGYYDQTESKFLELWVRGEVGRLHLDLGYISEDQHQPGQSWVQTFVQDGDTVKVRKGYGGQPDTEDVPSTAFPQGDGFVVESEDLGIDGLPSNTPVDLNKYGPLHPSWDHYEFNPQETPIDYTHINGAEGNLNIEGGTYPNTEDLNNDGALDTRNAYFTKVVDLSTEEYVAGRTKFSDGSETGWKLISIPLTDFDAAGDGEALWSQIKFARLWMDEVPMGGAQLQIATVDIVGNEWQERGVFSQYDRSEIMVTDSLSGTLNVSVINTEDNPGRYNAEASPGSYSAPPAGVEGILDPITQLRSKEQSLVIRADDLEPGHTVITDKQFRAAKAKDFIHYRTLKMFIHGWDKSRGGAYEAGFTDYVVAGESKAEFIFRFGETDNDFYEIRKPIYPGWDERNHLEINMADLANFKLALNDSLFANVPVTADSMVYDTSLYWYELPADFKYATKTLPDGTTIAVKGGPSLSRVKILKSGIKNLSDLPMSGEIWLDELRLSDVEKNVATAYRANLNVQLADVAKFNMDIQRNQADFHNVQEQFGSGDNLDALNLSGSFSAHKLLPSSWGLSVPVTASYRKSERQPKYMTGSDIRISDLAPELRDTVETMTTRNESRSWNFSVSKTTKSEHWLPKYTIDNMNFKLGGTKSTASDFKRKEQGGEKTDGSFSYNLNLGDAFKINPFTMAENVPLVGKNLARTELSYLPSKVGFSSSVVENKSHTIYRNPNSTPLTPVHQLSMNRNYSVDWAFLTAMNARYSATLSNNLDSLKNRKQDILKYLDFGHLGNYKESFSLNWSPRSLKLLSPTFSYSSNFSANDQIQSDQPGLTMNVNATTSANMTVSATEFFKLIYEPDQKSKAANNSQVQAGRGRGRARTTPKPEDEGSKEEGKAEKGEEEKRSALTFVMEQTYSLLERIDPISFNVSQGRQTASQRQIASIDTLVIQREALPDTTVYDVVEAELSDIDYLYRMGLELGGNRLNHPDVTNPLTTADNIKLTLRTGLKLTKKLTSKINFAFTQNNSLANRSQGLVQNVNHDYVPSGKLFGLPENKLTSFGNQGILLPSFNLRYSGLNDIEWIKKYISSASLDMNYAGKKTAYMEKGFTSRESYSISFSPLLGLNVSGKKNINGSVNYSLSKNINNSINSSSGFITSNQTFSQSMNASLTYEHKGGLRIPLPILKDKQLENNIDFRLEVSYTNEQNYSGSESPTGISFEEATYNKTLSVRPGMQYSFTDKVSGNVSYEYRIVDTRQLGRQDVSDFQFGVNIQIKG
ncbi:MAG: cell surface protein SprA [Candidatus Marinimicrobia bacterium]|nr:cell surface protein SprA [Candidatus Neomarinimicrobiota bacterium]MCF7850328.1 cell surface protein SprA [Candidatus Neomarinimicrobiota bacterium]MCF7904524.1 cell surface protein SprA [Candidatus Neomarinimicrobiota bacterium]